MRPFKHVSGRQIDSVPVSASKPFDFKKSVSEANGEMDALPPVSLDAK